MVVPPGRHRSNGIPALGIRVLNGGICTCRRHGEILGDRKGLLGARARGVTLPKILKGFGA